MMNSITKQATFYLLPFTFFLFSLNGFAQSCAPAPVGLVSWWRGENNALDSRSVNNGTLLNGVTFVAGKSGQGFGLSAGSSIAAPGAGSLDITGDQITIEAWIKLETNPAHPAQRFAGSIGKLGFPNDQNQILFENSGVGGSVGLPANQWQFEYILTNSSGTRVHDQSTGVIVTADGNFHHYALVYNGADTPFSTVKLYVDGVLRSTVAATVAGNLKSSPAEPFQISSAFGGVNSGNVPFSADEVSVYNRALSQTEIASIFNAGAAGKCKPTATLSPSGQIGWWPGDGNANDIAGTNNGTLQNGAIHIIGKAGQGVMFDGANSVLATPNSTLNNAFPAISIEGWVNPATHGTDETGTFGKTIVSNTNGDGFALRLLNGAIQSDLRLTGGDARTTFGTALPLNTWSHVALTYDGTNVRAFLNGVQAGSNFPASGTVKNTANSGICLFIGGDPSPACTADTGFGFNGGIDELSIYNRTITPEEIASIFNAGLAGKLKQNATINTSSLVSLWQGEGNANDTRGVNNGTFAGNIFASARIGQGFQVNSGNITIPDSNSLDFTNAYTIEMWVSPSVAGLDDGTKFLACKGNCFFANDQPYSIGFLGTRRVFLTVGNSTSIDRVTSNKALPLNTFSHVVGTYDGSTMRIYIDGVLDASQSTAIGTLVNSIGSFKFPESNSATTTGVYDEVALYNRALSPTEVRANYEAGNALSTVAGDARITFPTVSVNGITQQIPLDLSGLPGLPIGSSATGLAYDIATTAVFTGSPQVCFNLPSITNSTVFNNLRILHLESNAWINRTDFASINFAAKTICTTGLTSLSPFAIVNGFAPTAANASISGRMLTSGGRGIRGVNISIINSSTGEIKYAQSSAFGAYRFDDLPVGESYILSISSKRHTFAESSRVINLSDDLIGEDFIAQGK